MSDEGGQAFPHQFMPLSEPGMTLRDYFAGQAMVGIVISREFQGFGTIATVAYEIADAMLEARTKPAA
jgi:hypothetical protein